MRSKITGFHRGASALCGELAAHLSEKFFFIYLFFFSIALNPVFAHDEWRGHSALTNISGAARVGNAEKGFNVISGPSLHEFLLPSLTLIHQQITFFDSTRQR